METLQRFLCLVLFAVWWGGLTLYAAVVVPIGTKLFSATDQGFVTQIVTGRLNGLGAACLAMLFWYLLRHPSRMGLASWSIMALAAVALFFLHGTLDQMLDATARFVSDEEHFYSWHRYYLLVTTVQWVAGLVHLWTLCDRRGQSDRFIASPGTTSP